jgi:hypothetical protein
LADIHHVFGDVTTVVSALIWIILVNYSHLQNRDVNIMLNEKLFFITASRGRLLGFQLNNQVLSLPCMWPILVAHYSASVVRGRKSKQDGPSGWVVQTIKNHIEQG